MKLEFEPNQAPSPLVSNHVPSDLENQDSSPEILEMLREGIKAAQDGNRAVARNLLLKVTEADSRNENAWLWLASISEYPEELLVFLNNVLDINPENERALEWSAATKSLIAKTFVQRGIDAAKQDQRKFAKQCFLQAIVHDSESELAWLWLASVSDDHEEKMSHLQKVLSINPDNENAQSSLRNAREVEAKSLLPEANTAAISGKREEAKELLERIFADAPEFEDAWMLKAHISESFEEKILAFEKVLEINPENPVAKANIDSLKMFSGNQAAGPDEDAPSEEVGGDHINAFEHTVYGDEGSYGSEGERDVQASADVEPADAEPDEFEAQPEESGEESAYHNEESVPYEETVSGEEWKPRDEVFDNGSDSPEEEEYKAEPESEMAGDDTNPDHENAEFGEQEGFESAGDDNEPSNFDDVSSSDEDYHEDMSASDSPEFVDHDYMAEDVDAANVDSESEGYENGSGDSGEAEAGPHDDHSEYEASLESGEETDDDRESQDHPGEEMEVQQESEGDFGGDMEGDAGNDPWNTHDAREHHAEREPEMPSFGSAGDVAPEYPRDSEESHRPCPYCHEQNENQAFACQGCKAIFTVSDLDMILSHSKADRDVISNALERMESDKSLRGVEIEELKFMGIGYLNLKEYRKGLDCLKEAAAKDPNDVVLASQIDALAVRLSEIKEQQREQETMPEGKRILIVDDSPTVRKLISGKLEKCGHEAICAVDGMDALAKINEVIPDLILLDITMPRMDGYQVCKLIRGNDATKDVPVVMISGKDGFFDKVRGRMAGTTHYITKPFGPETLMKAVKEYIQ